MKEKILAKGQLRLLLCMYLGYAGFMVLKTAIVVAGPAILEDPTVSLTKTQWGALMGYGTLGGILGKFLSGWAADRFGGKRIFVLGLLVTALGVGVFSWNSHYEIMSLVFFLVLLAKSSGWPSMAKLIGNWYQSSQYGRVWGVLSTSSRTGTIVATLGIGSLLYIVSWRLMLMIAAFVGLALVILAYFFIHENPPKNLQSPESDEVDTEKYRFHPLFNIQLRQAIVVFLTSQRVWLICGSMMGLTILWDFLNFVPLFLKETLQMSNGDAATVTSAFPVGSFISVLLAGHFFDALPKSHVTRWIGLMLVLAILSVLVLMFLPSWGLSQSWNSGIVMACLALFGFTVAPAYYLPMSIFAIEYGGPHSGFLIAYLDAMGFAASMVFSFIGGAVADQSAGWNSFLLLILSVAVFSWILTVAFLVGEAKVVRNLENHRQSPA